jgi:hypothetical protein
MMEHNDIIDQGATFYREVTLYTDKALTAQLPKITGYSRPIRSTLLDQHGVELAVFSCAWIDEDAAELAWSMPAAVTGTLTPGKRYTQCIDTDEQNGEVIRRLRGEITVRLGQKKPVTP